MRLFASALAIALVLGVARADLAPPPLATEASKVPPAEREKTGEAVPHDITVTALTVLAAAAASGREDLQSMMQSLKVADESKRKGRTVRASAELPPNPCASDKAAAVRLCVQWLQNAMVRMEAASLDLMRAAAFEALGDLRKLGLAMRGAGAEQAALVQGEPPPARPIPANPCQGWNVSFWRDCVVRVDARLAGNLPDDKSAEDVIAARDRLTQSYDAMLAQKDMSARRIQQSLVAHAQLTEAVSRAVTRAEQAQRVLARRIKPPAHSD